jgi:Fe-S-cluster-containing hydrogenase component 2
MSKKGLILRFKESEIMGDKCDKLKEEVASITYDSCIGCGLCVSTCPTGSISMIHKQPDSMSHIFADDNDLIQARAKDTGKTFPFE